MQSLCFIAGTLVSAGFSSPALASDRLVRGSTGEQSTTPERLSDEDPGLLRSQMLKMCQVQVSDALGCMPASWGGCTPWESKLEQFSAANPDCAAKLGCIPASWGSCTPPEAAFHDVVACCAQKNRMLLRQEQSEGKSSQETSKASGSL